MSKIIRIGTRDSELALWQAKTVQQQLEYLGFQTEIHPIKSSGDLVLDQPLYEMGIVGIFTKNLDIALLNNEIDIAVHSLKDVPTVLPEKIVQAAVLKRGNYNDILVFKDNVEFMSQETAIIATGSLRRRAQWLNRYPYHTLVELRGNVNTRLEKLKKSNWNGAIFAAAGLERIDKKPEEHVNLNWMLPAPAQGTIMIAALEDDTFSREACAQLNHKETEICTTIERKFLNLLEGGCNSAIGALALIKDESVHFKGVLLSKDGQKKIEISKISKLGEEHTIANYCVGTMFEKGAKKLMLAEGTLDKKYEVYATKSLSKAQTKLFHNYFEVNSSDFIKTRFNRIAPKVLKDQIEHVVITSKNAVEAILTSMPASELQFKNIYCVGRRTKALIEKHIGPVAHTEKNAAKLALYLVKHLKEAPVTFFCGDLRRDELPEVLKQQNIELTEIEVYKAMYNPEPLKNSIAAVLFFSPSTVLSYLTKNKADRVAFCIGETTATEARKHFKKVKVSKVPTVESVIEAVNKYYEKNSKTS